MSAEPAQFVLPFSHYAKLGYLPIPIEAGQKRPLENLTDWNNPKRVWDYAALDAAGHSVGLLCENIVGLDIDITDADHAKNIEALIRKTLKLPKTTPRRVGRAPKALLIMRVETPLPGFDLRADKKVVLFQLLGAGKQFVVHGIHPDTGKPYTLNRPLPALAKLPLLTAAGLVALREAVGEGLTRLGYNIGTHAAVGGPKREGWSDRAWREGEMAAVHDALAGLDPDMDRLSWVNVGMALADGTHGSEEGFALWDEWSSAGSKYKQREMAKQWRSFKPGGITRASLFKNNWLKREPVVRQPVVSTVDEMDGSMMHAYQPGAVPWIVPDLLTHGAHLLVGRPKGGKSWVTLDLAYACAHGEPFVGRTVAKTRVLWIAGEDTRDSLARRLHARGPIQPGTMSIYSGEALRKARAELPEDDTRSFDEWLYDKLVADPSFGVVIVDTHATCEAIWKFEQLGSKARMSVTEEAYQMSRKFDVLGTERRVAVVLVHHMGKRKNHGKNADYHEKHNLPQTVVAGVTGSIVLDDPPDRDVHDDDDARRILAIRGRHMRDDVLMIELQFAKGRVKFLDRFKQFMQTQTQAETLDALEALLAEATPDDKGERWVTYKQIAAQLGKKEETILQSFKTMRKVPAKLVWKGRKVESKPGKGVRLV